MKTIKIIDLLNKIANGEEVPKKIIKHYLTGDLEWEFQDNCQVEYGYSMCCFCDKVSLNDEVGIIEDGNKIEKIERLEYSTNFNKEEFMLYKNILAVNGNVNDLIDKVNELEKRYEKQDK